MANKKIKRWFGSIILLTLIIVLIGGGLFLFKPALFVKDIQNRIVNLISSSTDISIKINGFEGNFFSGFVLQDVELSKKDTRISYISNISIDIELLKLIYGNLQFNDITIQNGYLLLDTYLENISIISRTNEIPFSTSIDQLTLDNILLVFQKDSINIDAICDVDISDVLSIGLDEISLKSNRITDNVKLKRGKISLDDNFLHFDAIQLSIDELSGDISGNLNINELYDFDLLATINDYSLDITNDDNVEISDIEIKVDGITESQTIRASIDSKCNFHNKSYDELSFSILLDTSAVKIDRGTLKNSVEKLEFVGNYNITKRNWQISTHATNIEYKNDSVLLQLNGDISVHGDTKLEHLNIQTDLENSYYNDFAVNSISGKFLYGGGKLESTENVIFDGNNLSGNISSISIDTEENNMSISGLFTHRNLDISEYYENAPQIRLSGISDIKLSKIKENCFIDGLVSLDSTSIADKLFIKESNIKFDISIDSTNSGFIQSDFTGLQIYDLDFDTADVFLSLDDGNITISDLNIWNANDEYFALQGVLFDNYNEFYVDSLTGNFRGVNFSSDDIHFTKLDNKFVLKKSLFKIGDGSAIATGDIIDSKKYRFWFNTENLNLSEVNTILGNDQRLQGIAKGEFHISMWEKYPIILSNVEIRNGVFDDIEFSKMLGKFSYRNNRLLFSEFSVNNQLGEISLSGWLTISGKDSASIFSETDSLKLNGSFDNFDLVSLNRYFPWSHNTEGLISGEFRMQGPASNPLFRMDLNINKPVFDKINGKSISGSIVYENKQLYMKGIKLLTDTGKYTCSGYLPVNLGLISTDIEHIKHYPMDIMITGKSKEFEFLLPYMAIIDSANGNYSYQLSITGTLKNPIRNGQVIVRDGSISLMPLENSFHSLNGIAFINNNRLILENFTATSYDVQNENSIVNKIKRFFTKETDKQEEPNITIKGSMSLENFFQPDYSLLLTANNLYLSTPADGFEGVGDANFTITGKDTIKITGEFTPHPYNFTVTSEFAKGDNNKLRKINPKKTIVYNIHVPLENIVKIENDYLDLVLEGDMNITAVGNEKFRYSGNLNVIDGTFFFNGNEYSQTEGTIILDPTTAIPKLDLHASTNVAGEGVDIVLLGELDNPNLILESEHGYSQNDIIELLLFRNSPSDENEIAINKAGNFVSNYLENEFERNITKYTIIDKFQVHSSGSLMSGYDDSSLSLYIGKNLSNKTYVNIKSGVNNEENTFEYELGYRLNRNMSIIGRIDEDRYLHLNYKIKYRY